MQFKIRKVNGVLHFLRAKLGWPMETCVCGKWGQVLKAFATLA